MANIKKTTSSGKKVQKKNGKDYLEKKPQKKEHDPQYKWLMSIAVVLFLIAFSVMFYSSNYEFGSDIYINMQGLAYGVVALMGGVMAYASKFNHGTSKTNIQVVGLVMIMLGLGRLLTMFLL